MKSRLAIALLTFVRICLSVAAEPNVPANFAAANDVTWTTLGTNENDSMPIGNGDLAANVWTEQSGDVVLLLAKADAWSEIGKLVKLGRVRIHLTPNPFVGASDFAQVLKLENSSIEIKSGANLIQVWIDANHPALHVEARLENPVTFQAGLELWRANTHSLSSPSPDRGGLFEFGDDYPPMDWEADTVFSAGTHNLAWCHFNAASVYPIVFQQEHLESLLEKYPDPLLHRCFGALLTGRDLVAVDDRILKSPLPAKRFRLDLYSMTQENAASVQSWKKNMDSMADKAAGLNPSRAWREHELWWSNFWDRSWIHVEGTPDAAKVSQGYAIQRYMMACCSRGAQPVKFNGGLFTVGHDMPQDEDSTRENHDPDFRAWGNSYWNQNNRLMVKPHF